PRFLTALVAALLTTALTRPTIEDPGRPRDPVVDPFVDTRVDLSTERIIEVVGQLAAEPFVPRPQLDLVPALLILAQIPERRPAHEQEDHAEGQRGRERPRLQRGETAGQQQPDRQQSLE